jgi:hypothetical protein
MLAARDRRGTKFPKRPQQTLREIGAPLRAFGSDCRRRDIRCDFLARDTELGLE